MADGSRAAGLPELHMILETMVEAVVIAIEDDLGNVAAEIALAEIGIAALEFWVVAAKAGEEVTKAVPGFDHIAECVRRSRES